MRKSMKKLVRKGGSLVMAAALAVGMTACSSQSGSQTTAAETAAESQSKMCIRDRLYGTFQTACGKGIPDGGRDPGKAGV